MTDVLELTATGQALAGCMAASTNLTLTYPLDLIKTRFQVHDGNTKGNPIPKYRSTFTAISSIARIETFRGLYQGLPIALFGSTVSWGMYMYCYSIAKSQMEARYGSLQFQHFFVSGIISGVSVAMLTNPIWVIKTRLQLQQKAKNSVSTDNLVKRVPYKGAIDAISRILREEGITAFYKGMAPALFASLQGGIQFGFYETLMARCAPLIDEDSEVVRWLDKSTKALAFGGMSRIVAVLLTHPFYVIRSRLHDQRAFEPQRYSGLFNAAMTICRNEGFLGLYKGMGPSLWRLALSSASFFFLLEQARNAVSWAKIFNVKSST